MRMHGKCLCGAVKFMAEVPKPTFSACHCGMCRRWSGGAPFFAVGAQSVTFDGEESLGRFASSKWAERGFCKTCGSVLFYFLVPAKRYAMSAGAFDDPSLFELSLEIFVDRKPAGYSIAGDHPRWTEAETLAKLAPPSP